MIASRGPLSRGAASRGGEAVSAADHGNPIQPRFNLATRRPIDSGNQRQHQVSAKVSAELVLRCTSCSFELAGE